MSSTLSGPVNCSSGDAGVGYELRDAAAVNADLSCERCTCDAECSTSSEIFVPEGAAGTAERPKIDAAGAPALR